MGGGGGFIRNSFIGGLIGGLGAGSGANAAGSFAQGVAGGALAAAQGGGGGNQTQATQSANTQAGARGGFLDQSGLWTTPPFSDYNAWRNSIGFLMDRPRGFLGMRDRAIDDKIISLCDVDKPPPADGTFLATNVPGVLRARLLSRFPQGGKVMLATYFGLRIVSDGGRATVKFLPTSGSSTGSDAPPGGSLTTDPDLFFSGLASDLRTRPPAVVKAPGKIQEAAGAPKDTMVVRSNPTVYAVLAFSIEQLGGAPAPPNLKSIDGMTDIHYVNGAVEIANTGNYTLIVDGRETAIQSVRLSGFQVYKVLDPKSGSALLEIPPNFCLQNYGNVANYYAGV